MNKHTILFLTLMSIEINCLKVAAFSFGSRIHAVVAVFEQLAVKTN